MKILFLSRWYPYPPDNGSKLRIYHLLRGLSHSHQVSLLSFFDPSAGKPDKSALLPFCEAIDVLPLRSGNGSGLKGKARFFSPQPRWALDAYSIEMKELIERTLESGNYRLVIASQLDMAIYFRSFGRVPAIFEEAEVGPLYERFAIPKSNWERFRYGLTWAKHRRFLARLLPKFLVSTVVSRREQELLSSAVPGYPKIEIIPNCVSLDDYAGVEKGAQTNTIIYTGSLSYFPNYHAMRWFLSEVYPRVRAAVPEVRLLITGNPGDRLLPASEGVELTGYVDDIRRLVASSAVSLAPIRFGGGTRLKILEAMALRTPVVSTTKGAEGLEVRDAVDILLADTPEAFAEAVICLLKDPALGQRIAGQALKLVRSQYEWSAVFPRFLRLVDRSAQQPQPL